MSIFVGNLKPGTTTSDLLDFFEEDEGITEIAIVKRPSPEGELRYGHVFFGSDSEAEKAIRRRQQKELYGDTVSVRRFMSRTEENDRRSIIPMKASHSGPERRHGERRKGNGH